MEKEFDFSRLKFSFDISNANYQLDELQNQLLQFYLRADHRFRRAFSINFTNSFIKFLKDKTRLNEPIHISILGHTRTFTNNHLIYTDLGMLKPSEIEEKKPKKVLSYNFDKEEYEWKKYQLIRRKRDLKEKFYKVIFSDNRELILGENHPIFTKNKGWKKAYSLYKGIKIPFFSNFLEQNSLNLISKERARIYAFILSCGHLKYICYKSYLDKRVNKFYKKECYSVEYANSSIEMVNQYKKDMKKEFNLIVNDKEDKRNIKCYYTEKGSKKIVLELSKVIPIGKKAHIIEIPKDIFNSSKEIHKEFINVLFSGDGYVSKKGNIIEYYSCSKRFIQQLQMLLLQYGIISVINIKIRKEKKHHNLYRLTITNKKNILNFQRLIGKMYNIRKEKRLKHICCNLKKLSKNLKPRKFYIKDVKKAKIDDNFIYDIYVEGNNNFFLNGILTHNSGKSYTAITICLLHQAQYGRLFESKYICANSYEFLDKLQKFPEEELLNRIFLIDEEKKAVFGAGSVAKKMKLEDVQNIIAINNISTISLNPTGWANKEADYGLRTFGRCFETQTCRMMLYNLQEKGKGGETPMGNIYLPIFTAYLPQPYAKTLEKEYLDKKNAWVKMEMRGEGDVLETLKKRTALMFIKDPKFKELKKKKDKITYISVKLGSEWTKSEIDQIETIIGLYQDGALDDEDME